ncbi:glycosyltransferase [Niabella sp. CC-SYL272]|uniref:glycosyltransferase n=1 Tax=Niabella agricola TaxID=2891571 RepID=UPI001F3B8F30|nr:glycosyltransferase [Niabella agricola]MCF3108423.1 glycosyltransferase [Niabella agricola]
MLKVLWLCSWYPNKRAPFEGDFVQRHAQAASLYHRIHVIKVTPDPEDLGVTFEQQQNTEYPNLTEEHIYYPKKPGVSGKLRSYFYWFHLYKKAVRRYISVYGKPDLVHVHIPFKSGLVAQWIKKKYGIPYVVTEHWDGYNTVVDDNFYERPRWFRSIVRNTFHKATGFHSVSRYLVREINQLGKEIPSVVIPNVADTRIFFKKQKERQQQFRCVHISSGAPKKNIEGIIRAFGQLPASSFSLTVIGLEPRLNVAYKERYPWIRWIGVQPYNIVARELQEADLLIVFSNAENSPCVIGEALCCGVPVVSSDVGGISELINDQNGLMIPAGDEAALVNAIRFVEAHYPDYNATKIASDASTRFSYAVVGQQIDRWYQGLKNPS